MCFGDLTYIYLRLIPDTRFISKGQKNFKNCKHANIFDRDDDRAPSVSIGYLPTINHVFIIIQFAPRLLLYSDVVILTDCLPMIEWRENYPAIIWPCSSGHRPA